MSESDKKSRQANIGCLAVVVLVIGVTVGGGLYLGMREDASKEPCERYAQVYTRQLNNCHSGTTKNHAHHIEICEREVSPTDACIEAIEAMTCEQLEVGPANVAPQVCGQPH